MTDIQRLTAILRQFAEHKRERANELLAWKPGMVFRAHIAERARRLQHEASDIIGYADEIESWWENR